MRGVVSEGVRPDVVAWVERLWAGSDPEWTDLRAEQVFRGTLSKLESRRRRRQVTLAGVRVATVAMMILMGLGLAAFGWSGDRMILPR
jgi:hypothetical protein